MTVKKYMNNKGITLVELIMVTVLIGIIVVPLGTMFIKSYISYYRDNAKIKASYDMRYALNDVLESFRYAQQDSITLENEQKVTFIIDQNGSTYNGAIWYNSIEKCLKIQTQGTERTLLKNVSGVTMQYVEEDRISVRVTTVTSLPFNEPYIYTQTYDYKKRI